MDMNIVGITESFENFEARMKNTQKFIERYKSQDDLDTLRRALYGAYEYCQMHRSPVSVKRRVLEVAAMSALQDYDCFDADWLQDITDETLKYMERIEVFSHAIQWAVEW